MPRAQYLPAPTHILRCFGHRLDLRMGRPTGTAHALPRRSDRLPIGLSVLTILVLSALSWAVVPGIVMLFV